MVIYTSTGESYETKFDQVAATLEQTSEGFPYFQAQTKTEGTQVAMMKKGHPVTDPVSSDPLGTEIERQAGGIGRGGSSPIESSRRPITSQDMEVLRREFQRTEQTRRRVNSDQVPFEFETPTPPAGRVRELDELRPSERTLYNMYNNLRNIAEQYRDSAGFIRHTQNRDRILREGWYREPEIRSEFISRPNFPLTDPIVKPPVDFNKLKASLKLKEKAREEFHWEDAMWVHPGDRAFELADSSTGKTVGFISLNEQNKGKTLYVNYVHADPIGGPNSLGQLIRPLIKQVKEIFPDAEKITGLRISGARRKAREEAEAKGSDRYVDARQTIWLKKPKEGDEPQFFMPEPGRGNWPWSQTDSDTSSTFTSLGTTMQEASAQAQDFPVDRILQSYKINPKAWEDWLANSPMSENIEDRRGESGQDVIGDLIRGILDERQFVMRRPTLSDPLTTEIDKQAAGMSPKSGRTQANYWSKEKFDRAKELANEGKTRQQIADELGTSLDAVVSKFRREGVKVRKDYWPAEKFKKALELRNEGKSFREIANELGTTKNSVVGKFHHEGLSQ